MKPHLIQNILLLLFSLFLHTRCQSFTLTDTFQNLPTPIAFQGNPIQENDLVSYVKSSMTVTSCSLVESYVLAANLTPTFHFRELGTYKFCWYSKATSNWTLLAPTFRVIDSNNLSLSLTVIPLATSRQVTVLDTSVPSILGANDSIAFTLDNCPGTVQAMLSASKNTSISIPTEGDYTLCVRLVNSLTWKKFNHIQLQVTNINSVLPNVLWVEERQNVYLGGFGLMDSLKVAFVLPATVCSAASSTSYAPPISVTPSVGDSKNRFITVENLPFISSNDLTLKLCYTQDDTLWQEVPLITIRLQYPYSMLIDPSTTSVMFEEVFQLQVNGIDPGNPIWLAPPSKSSSSGDIYPSTDDIIINLPEGIAGEARSPEKSILGSNVFTDGPGYYTLFYLPIASAGGEYTSILEEWRVPTPPQRWRRTSLLLNSIDPSIQPVSFSTPFLTFGEYSTFQFALLPVGTLVALSPVPSNDLSSTLESPNCWTNDALLSFAPLDVNQEVTFLVKYSNAVSFCVKRGTLSLSAPLPVVYEVKGFNGFSRNLFLRSTATPVTVASSLAITPGESLRIIPTTTVSALDDSFCTTTHADEITVSIAANLSLTFGQIGVYILCYVSSVSTMLLPERFIVLSEAAGSIYSLPKFYTYSNRASFLPAMLPEDLQVTHSPPLLSVPPTIALVLSSSNPIGAPASFAHHSSHAFIYSLQKSTGEVTLLTLQDTFDHRVSLPSNDTSLDLPFSPALSSVHLKEEAIGNLCPTGTCSFISALSLHSTADTTITKALMYIIEGHSVVAKEVISSSLMGGSYSAGLPIRTLTVSRFGDAVLARNGSDGLTNPSDIFETTDFLYVVDRGNYRVVVLEKKLLRYIDCFGSSVSSSNAAPRATANVYGFLNPASVTWTRIDGGFFLLVLDQGSQRLSRYSIHGHNAKGQRGDRDTRDDTYGAQNKAQVGKESYQVKENASKAAVSLLPNPRISSFWTETWNAREDDCGRTFLPSLGDYSDVTIDQCKLHCTNTIGCVSIHYTSGLYPLGYKSSLHGSCTLLGNNSREHRTPSPTCAADTQGHIYRLVRKGTMTHISDLSWSTDNNVIPIRAITVHNTFVVVATRTTNNNNLFLRLIDASLSGNAFTAETSVLQIANDYSGGEFSMASIGRFLLVDYASNNGAAARVIVLINVLVPYTLRLEVSSSILGTNMMSSFEAETTDATLSALSLHTQLGVKSTMNKSSRIYNRINIKGSLAQITQRIADIRVWLFGFSETVLRVTTSGKGKVGGATEDTETSTMKDITIPGYRKPHSNAFPSLCHTDALTICNSHGFCDNERDECMCQGPYYGERCQYKKCDSPCLNGSSCNTMTGLCNCPANYEGEQCQDFICPIGTVFSGTPCNGRGECDRFRRTCVCSSGYFGQACEFSYCPLSDTNTPCNNRGTCSYDNATPTCQCESGWFGKSCEHRKG